MNLYPYARRPFERGVAMMLYEKQGGKCSLENPASACEFPLEIDHIDGNPGNWDPKNVRLLCHRHNIGQRSKNVSVSKETDATEQLHGKVDYSTGAPEMQVNDDTEVPFRNYIEARLRREKRPIGRRALQDDGAELFGISIATADRHLRKLCAPTEGRLKVFKPPRGPRAVWWKVPPDE